MKKLIVILVLLSAAACSRVDNADPASVSDAFLNAYFGYDLEQASELATAETAEEINVIKSLLEQQGVTPKQAMKDAEPFKLTIHTVVIDGDTATCNYTIQRDKDDRNAMPENMTLVRINGKWLADF